MSGIKKFILSTDFLTSDLQSESSLLQNINKKYLKDFILYKKNIFIEIYNIDILLLPKNDIVFYPYNIKLTNSQNTKIIIPIFLENPSLLTLLLKTKKIKFKEIFINNIDFELTEKEKEYYYQEKTFIDILLKKK